MQNDKKRLAFLQRAFTDLNANDCVYVLIYPQGAPRPRGVQ